MKFKRLISFSSAIILSLSSLVVFAPVFVHAAAISWTGGGSDSKFSTGANWSGGVAPVAGDSLVFPALVTQQAPVNDTTLTYSGMSFTGASGSCTASPYSWYSIIGTQPLSLSGTIANNMTGECSDVALDLDVTLTASISVTGTGYVGFGTNTLSKTLALGSNTLTFAADNYGSVTSAITGSIGSSIIVNNPNGLSLNGSGTAFTGSVVVNSGQLVTSQVALGSSSSVTVNNGAELAVDIYKNSTLNTPIMLNGAAAYPESPKFTLSVYGDAADTAEGVTTLLSATYAGALTLGSDTTIGVYWSRNKVTISGALSGAYKITRQSGEAGKLVIAGSPNTTKTANGDLTSARKEVTISSDQAFGTYTPGNYQTTINEGKTVTGDSQVTEDGILIVKGKIVGTLLAKDDSIVKGTGVIEGPVTLSQRAKLAPGLSPGCLSTGNLTFASGTSYDFEVGGATACTEYDQTKVTGTVTLGNGTLNTILYNGFKPAKGQSYKIIDNDASDAVSGTFNNLAEGATFTVAGYVLKISYVGGDGNDVVLAVQSVPATPDTGFELITAHPIITLFTTTFLAAAIALIGRRYSKMFAR